MSFWDNFNPYNNLPQQAHLDELDLLQRKVDNLETIVFKLKNDVTELENKLESLHRRT